MEFTSEELEVLKHLVWNWSMICEYDCIDPSKKTATTNCKGCKFAKSINQIGERLFPSDIY